MAGSKITRRRNEEAKRQEWKCHWCQAAMTPVPMPPRKGEHYPPTMVTLDHLFPKGDLRRKNPPRNGERRYVAACRSCNEERGKAHERSFGKVELLRRSKARALQYGRQPLPLEPAS
ncbi:MAG TPA: hypothetical protein VK577_03580 [Bradyrhizobium sp.]|nr:hypothetical protein [Bradyrhizobium sp.]